MTYYLANHKSLDNEYLNSLFHDLEIHDYNLVFGPCLYNEKEEKKEGRMNKYVFFLKLPFLIFKAKKEIKEHLKNDSLTIICASWPERIIFSCLLKLHGKREGEDELKKENGSDSRKYSSKKNSLKVQWWFLPGAKVINNDYSSKSKKLIDNYSKSIKLVAFHKREKEKLEEYYDKKVFHFPLLLKSPDKSHQESIFDNLSKSKSLNFFHRYFSILVLADLKHKHYTETIIKALPELLRAIPSAQLLVIGLNKDHESLKWLAKKLNVEKNVWFLNEKDHINEWLETANLFILSNQTLSLCKYYYLLLALNKSLRLALVS